jgi:hypothetical protein
MFFNLGVESEESAVAFQPFSGTNFWNTLVFDLNSDQ